MATPTVSIFVQVYNTEPYLRRCLESVLALRGPWEKEIVVIDDASRDESDRILEEFRTSMRIIRHTQNLGANATANEGYALCRGKYLIRLDSDDSFRPNLLEELLPLLEKNPEAGLAYGDVALMDMQNRITSPAGNVQRQNRPNLGDEFFQLCAENFICAPATLVRSEAIRPLLPVPSEYSFLDWYVTTGIAHRWKTAFSPAVVADYRVHPENQHGRMVLDGSGERISFAVLDRLWAESHRAEEKRGRKNRVYGENLFTYAEKYFWAGMNTEARRCYQEGFRCLPGSFFKRGRWRRWLATHMPRASYERWKAHFLQK